MLHERYFHPFSKLQNLRDLFFKKMSCAYIEELHIVCNKVFNYIDFFTGLPFSLKQARGKRHCEIVRIHVIDFGTLLYPV